MVFRRFLASLLLVSSLGAQGFLYDGVVRYWHADMSGEVGQTDKSVSEIEGDSDGVMTFGFRLDNGRSLLEVLYSRMDINGQFGGSNQGNIFATDENSGTRTGPITPVTGDYVNFDVEKIDVHLHHPLVIGDNMAFSLIGGLSWMEAQDELAVRIPNSQRAKANFESLLGVVGVEFEYYLNFKSSIRGSYRYGREVSEDYARLKDWEVAYVLAPEAMMEFELGYKSMSLKSRFFEDSVEEWELEREFKGPYAQMNVLF